MRKFHAADDTQLLQYGACAPPDSKMGTEVVRAFTHADAPHRGYAPHSAQRPVCIYHALQ
jgi:hypothetical protein